MADEKPTPTATPTPTDREAQIRATLLVPKTIKDQVIERERELQQLEQIQKESGQK